MESDLGRREPTGEVVAVDVHSVEKLADDLSESAVLKGVEVVLAIAPRFEQSGGAEQSEVMADGRLALAEAFAESRNVKFAFAGQREHALRGMVEVGAERDQLAQLFEELGSDASVRAIILTGAGGKAFTAGGDIAGFLEREPETGSALLHALQSADDDAYVQVCAALAEHDVRDRLAEIDVPVLAVADAVSIGSRNSMRQREGSGTTPSGPSQGNVGVTGKNGAPISRATAGRSATFG